MQRRVKINRTSHAKCKTIYYTIADDTLKQFSDLSEDTCEEDSEVDSVVTETELLSSNDVILVGDVIWSRVSKLNWWPSMVAYDPNSAIYFQTSSKYPSIPLKYHVQFFGENPVRGWVNKSNILKFEGKQHFLELSVANYLSANQRDIWEEAVKEAEGAVLLERKERKLAYVFNYLEQKLPKKKRDSTKKRERKVEKTTAPGERKSSRLALSVTIAKSPKKTGDHSEIHNTNSLNASNSTQDTNSSDNLTVITTVITKPLASNQTVNCISSIHSECNCKPAVKVSPVLQDISCKPVVQLSPVLKDISCKPVVQLSPVLKDISWVNNDLLNHAADVENSSDSGIEDIETMESSCDDIETLGLKRKRKRKVYEGFHTGDEINDAFKSKSKSKEKKEKETDKGDEGNVTDKCEKENVITDKGCSPAALKMTPTKKKDLKGSPVKCSPRKCSDSALKMTPTKTKDLKTSPVKCSPRKCPNSALKMTPTKTKDVKKSPARCSPMKSPNVAVKKKSPGRCSPAIELKTNVRRSLAPKSEVSSSETEVEVLPQSVGTARQAKRKCDVAEEIEKTSVSGRDSKTPKRVKENTSINNIIIENDMYTKIKKTNSAIKKLSELSTKTNSGDDEDKNNQKERDPRDQFCVICEEVGEDLILCSGTCLNEFHATCIGLNNKPTTDFTCDECTTGYHTCFVCRKAGEIKKCSHNTCGKYYHSACLENNVDAKFESKAKDKFTCPLHVCKYCNKEKLLKSNSTGRRLLKCIRCPKAYHQTGCIPAGCSPLTYNYMICDKHYEAKKSHINTTWCFSCSLGGSLVCCDTCPASFHAECCDDLTGVPEGGWQCEDCRSGAGLRYGSIVWVKYSMYRWWPGQICLPEEVPVRIQNLPHSIGEFPVLFFGSRDYAWLNSGRVFKYAEGDKGAHWSKKGSLAKYFVKALAEAKETFSVLEKEKMEQIAAFGKKQSDKPPPYKQIKLNRPLTCIQTVLDRSEWPICHCTAEKACNNECLNKMLYYECNPLQCPAGEACNNQRMQKWQYAKAEVFKCEGKGWGLRSKQELKTGDFVIEYVGELIDEATCRIRIQQYHEKDIYDYYFLTIDKDNIIDAYPKGNMSRFMNHSCDPNCETQKWMVSGEVRVGLFATRDILVGEELSFNYNLDCLGNEKKQCKCGAANCSGFLGVQPKTQHSMHVAEKAKQIKHNKNEKKKKLKRKKVVKRLVHDDECFSCGDGGELICCDRLQCTKTYHQDCLIMDERPRGKWSCPWHFCDECGKIARSMCSLCPNSFCESHLDGQMTELKEDVIVCPAHGKREMEALLRKAKVADVVLTDGDSESSPKKTKVTKQRSSQSPKSVVARSTSTKARDQKAQSEDAVVAVDAAVASQSKADKSPAKEASEIKRKAADPKKSTSKTDKNAQKVVKVNDKVKSGRAVTARSNSKEVTVPQKKALLMKAIEKVKTTNGSSPGSSDGSAKASSKKMETIDLTTGRDVTRKVVKTPSKVKTVTPLAKKRSQSPKKAAVKKTSAASSSAGKKTSTSRENGVKKSKKVKSDKRKPGRPVGNSKARATKKSSK